MGRARRRRRNVEAIVAEVTDAPRSFDIRYDLCIGRSPMIGLRDLREPVTTETASMIKEGLRLETKTLDLF